MSEHILTITHHAKGIPSKRLPDGAIAGNGDVAVVLSGGSDRVRIHINKSDFWNADGRKHTEHQGGIAPLGIVELLIPQLAYADYKVEQNIDRAYIGIGLTAEKFTANIKVTVCAGENTVIIELVHTHPAVSTSLALVPIEGSESVTYSGTEHCVNYLVRGFDTPECRFPTYGICAVKQVSRVVSGGRERIVWAVSVCTNHDTAAYKSQAIERTQTLDESDCVKLLALHEEWWESFWSKSGVVLPDKHLELYWYASIYSVACCMRNKKFPPGLWGTYSTSDGMGWYGDYHLNYNYEAPFYALTSSNHTELMECYFAPLNDFLPIAKRFAKDFLGIDGAYYPSGIGPLGLETGFDPDTKEHGHLFLGQKSNGAYAAVIAMMHWYGTRDKEFARREYYDFLLSVAEFWENYLVFEDGVYQIYNDSLNEVEWWSGPDHMPSGHDDKNSIVSRSLVAMLMKLMIELSNELGINTDRIPKWQYILERLVPVKILESNGDMVLCAIEGCEDIREVSLESMYPIGAIGKYTTPNLFEAAKNSHKRLSIWDSENRFCSYYPMAARLEYPPEEIISHIYDAIENRGLPNGMFRYAGGGIENSAAIPATINEMLLQSYEGIVRLFPVWDRERDASFHGLRAYGAFIVNADVTNGIIQAEILSEKGEPLLLERPGENYFVLYRGHQKRLADTVTRFETVPQEKITVFYAE